MKLTGRFSLALIAVMAGYSASALAQAPNFFAGKTIRVIVGFSPGAAYDRLSRILAEHMPKHIPGKPVMVVENMVGAGSILANNYVFGVAPKDGTVIVNINSNSIIQEMIGQEGIAFKSEQFNWLGATAKTRVACIVNNSTGVKSMDDLVKPRDKLVNIAALGPGSESTTVPMFLRYAGAQIKVISGYAGNAQSYLAAEQGEVDGLCSTWESMKTTGKNILDSGKFTVFVQGGESKSPELPDAQLMVEALMSPVHKAVWAAIDQPQQIARPFAVPPGVPADRVAILRKAFEDTVKDPAFIATMAKTGGDAIDPSTPDQMAAVVKKILATPAAQKEDLKKLLTAQN